MKYVTIKKFAELSGYTAKAVQAKLYYGVWGQGEHYRKAPDGHVMIDCQAFERWVEGADGCQGQRMGKANRFAAPS